MIFISFQAASTKFSSFPSILLPHRPILCYPPQTVPQIPVSSPIGNSRKWFRKSMPHSFPQRIFSPTMYIIIQGKAAVLPCKLFFKKVTVLPCKLCHQTVVQLFRSLPPMRSRRNPDSYRVLSVYPSHFYAGKIRITHNGSSLTSHAHYNLQRRIRFPLSYIHYTE